MKPRTYRYKVKRMKPEVQDNIEHQLSLACNLYNSCIEQRRSYWKHYQKSVSANQQMLELTEMKQELGFEEYKSMGSQVLQDVVQRVDLAYQAYFRRIKSGDTPGYPRFKSWRRYDSLTFKQAGWKFVSKSSIQFQGIGRLKFCDSRDFPEDSIIKTITLKRDACGDGDWFISFSLDLSKSDIPKEPKTGKTVGIDLGLLKYYTDDQGASVPNPRFLKKSEKNLKIEQRKLSKKERGGKNYEKQKVRLAKAYRKVKNARLDHQHKLARSLVQDYDLIIIEELKIKQMIETGLLAKSIYDAGWAQFTSILISKAEDAGKQVRLIDPKNTSQMCSNCRDIPEVKKTLADRTHKCKACGFELDRDHNAARNIKSKGRRKVRKHNSSKIKSKKDNSKAILGGKLPMGRTRLVKDSSMNQESPAF